MFPAVRLKGLKAQPMYVRQPDGQVVVLLHRKLFRISANSLAFTQQEAPHTIRPCVGSHSDCTCSFLGIL